MNSLLLNRNGFQMPADGWYQVAPLGEFAHAQAGVVQVVDAEACTAMVNRFHEESGRQPVDKLRADRFAGLLVDFDHFSLDGEKRSEAAGWITELENRDGGLFAKIRWSDVGEEAVKGGRYRFLSPVWARRDCVDLGNGRVRPVRLLNAAVTNDPNLKGMQPLSNSAIGAAADGAQRFKWVLGATQDGRHCPTCTAAAGQVHAMAEWDAAKVKPCTGGLFCQGNCRCRLEPTTEAAGGVLADVPVRKEDNPALANTGWTDEARAASLAVRRAKAAARGMTPAQARSARLMERQRLSMEKASRDYAAIYTEKGLDGMTSEEKRYMAARTAVRVRNGSKLTAAEERFLKDVEKAGVSLEQLAPQPRRPVQNDRRQGRRDVDSGKLVNGAINQEGAAMSGKADGKPDGAVAGAAGAGTEVEQLTNALRLEQAKNEVLLGEVVALEDEIVNRAMADFDAVVSDETREFWREQLLANREKATVALSELARAKQVPVATATAGAGPGGAAAAPQSGAAQTRRPLHNRALSRPLPRVGYETAAGAALPANDADDRAAKIRNRAHEISRTDRVTFAVAFRKAELELGSQ